MKCPNCGAENLKVYGPCRGCGKPLSSIGVPKKQPEQPAQKPSFDLTRFGRTAPQPAQELKSEDIASKMKMAYLHGAKDQNIRAVEGIQKLLLHFRKKEMDLRGLIEEAANLIHENYRIRWVAIGLKNPRDGLFRYDALVGFRDDAAKARKAQAFTESDFTQDTTYKGWVISDQSKVYLEEDKPYTDGAEGTFNRPSLLKARRLSPEDSLEADYLDVHIYGSGNELIGWIEMSGTLTGKLPDLATIKTIEMIASIIGAAVTHDRAMLQARG